MRDRAAGGSVDRYRLEVRGRRGDRRERAAARIGTDTRAGGGGRVKVKRSVGFPLGAGGLL
jgi:hypothetical protein